MPPPPDAAVPDAAPIDATPPDAAVIDAEEYRAFKEWSEQTTGRNVAEEFAELRQIMQEENYELSLPPRTTRRSASSTR